MELDSVETVTDRWYKKLFDDVKQRHAEETNVCKESFAENADGLLNDVLIANADSAKMSVEMSLVLIRFE